MAIRFAYFRTPDNTIAEVPFELEDDTLNAVEFHAVEWGNAYGFHLIAVAVRQWEDAVWDSSYANLERMGFYTAERRAELFDN